MACRLLPLALLVILAAQMLGGFAMSSVCVEPCPDETEETSCPPVCALCTTCRHAQSALLAETASRSPLLAAERCVPGLETAPATQLESDIFHVPLLG